MNRKEELLVMMQEECAEVSQAISKILRFGEDAYHPKDRKKTPNSQRFYEELGDLFCTMKVLLEENHIDGEAVMEAAEKKFKKLEKLNK